MTGLLISYGDLEYDGRLRSLISIFSEVCDLHTYTRGTNRTSIEKRIVNNSTYLSFIPSAVDYYRNNPVDILILDNRKATIPGLLIHLLYKPSVIIQDCRELYLFEETKHITGKIGCIFERVMARRANIVICANDERAEILQYEYHLDNKPLVYENIRKLEYQNTDSFLEAKKRIDPYLEDSVYRIVSSSGCSILRTNDVLVKALNNIDYPCQLFLVGSSTTQDIDIIEKLAKTIDHNHTITIIDQLNQSELKYLISKSHVGIVNYGQYDTNNKYCASGKLFEFLYEGIPVVATENPPLKRIIDKTKTGICDNSYFRGINIILGEFDNYKYYVNDFKEQCSIDDYNEGFASQIVSYLETHT